MRNGKLTSFHSDTFGIKNLISDIYTRERYLTMNSFQQLKSNISAQPITVTPSATTWKQLAVTTQPVSITDATIQSNISRTHEVESYEQKVHRQTKKSDSGVSSSSSSNYTGGSSSSCISSSFINDADAELANNNCSNNTTTNNTVDSNSNSRLNSSSHSSSGSGNINSNDSSSCNNSSV